MSQYNPYEPPRAADAYSQGAEVAGDADAVPDAIVEPLRATRPWVTFLAILGFIGAGLMGIGGLFILGLGRLGNLPAGFGLVYIVLGVVYVFPSLHLLRYGSAIARLVRDPRMERLGIALGHQRSFWKLVGIMTAVILALYPIGIVVAVVAVVATKKF